MLFRVARDGTYLNFIPGVAAEPLVEPSQFIGKQVGDILPGELAEEVMRAIERALKSGDTQSWEYQLAQDGELRHFEARISRCAEAEVLAIVRDVTEHKRADEALGENEQRLLLLNSISHRISAGMSVEEVIRGTLEELSKYFTTVRVAYSTIDDQSRLTVLSSVEPDGMPPLAGIEVDLAAAPGSVQALLKHQAIIVEDVNQDARTGPFAVPMSTGGTRALLDVPLHHSDELVGLLCFDSPEPRVWTKHEIATLRETAESLSVAIKNAHVEQERKRAEEALRESEETYRTLFELASDAFLTVLLPDGTIIDANLAAAELLGYSRYELVGRSGRQDIIAPEVLEQTDQEWQTQLEENGRFSVETLWVRKDGTRVPVIVSGTTVEVRGQPQFQLIGRDITERKQAEEALRKTREELEGRVERQLLHKNPYQLTFREFTVLHHVAAGRADKEIAHELGISPLTVHKHVANILGKMNAASRTEAGVRALREGLLD